MTWFLRRATPEDLDAIMAIEMATFTTDAWSERVMAGELASEHSHYLVAIRELTGDIDGYGGLLAPKGVRQADIQTIAVAEDARRGGLGRALMHQLMTEARQRGASEIFLEVRADNPNAKALYESLGFEVVGARPKYYQPDGVDAIVMRVTLQHPEASVAGEEPA